VHQLSNILIFHHSSIFTLPTLFSSIPHAKMLFHPCPQYICLKFLNQTYFLEHFDFWIFKTFLYSVEKRKFFALSNDFYSNWRSLLSILWVPLLPICARKGVRVFLVWRPILSRYTRKGHLNLCRLPCFQKPPLWLKLTPFSGALNCFLKGHLVVEMVCEPNTY